MSLLAALRKLDKDDDNHWTADGLPIVAIVQELAADTSITRKMITSAIPGYTRESLQMEAESGEPDAQKPESDAQKAESDAQKAEGDAPEPDAPEETEPLAANAPRVYQTVDDVRAHMAELEVEGTELARVVNASQERIKTINIIMSQISTLIPDSMADHQGNMTAIQRYIAQCQQTRVEKAERVTEFLKHGVDLAALNPKSKIDQALNNRNRNPANKRAKWPLKQTA